jgi:hypothetical protein
MSYSEDELYDMDDEAAEAAFKAAKLDLASPDVEGTEQGTVEEDSAVEEEFDEIAEDTEDTSESDNEELESDLEQPEEASDHDASTEDEEVETTDEESEAESDNPDGDEETVEDNSETEEETETDEVQPVRKQSFKANGRDYEFTDEEITTQFPKIFGQAMDYTKKMQAIKPWRKTIDAMESASLDHNDVSLMIDVLKGDKDAISEVIRRTGVDALDLDAENSTYTAKDYGRDDKALDIKDVVESIRGDKEYSTTHDILATQWDDSSWKSMSDDPQMIKLLHDDVQSGMYDKLQPIMDKMKVFGGSKKSDLEYYGMAATEYYNGISQEQEQQKLVSDKAEQRAAQQVADVKAKEDETLRMAEVDRVAKVKAQDATRLATQKASTKRKNAAPTTTTAGKRDVTDYLDDSDEAYEEWYAKVQAKS